MHCDFCHVEVGDNPITFAHPEIVPPGDFITYEAGEWAAYPECATLHKTGSVDELIERALNSEPNIKWFADIAARGYGQQIRDTFRYIYERISRIGYYDPPQA